MLKNMNLLHEDYIVYQPNMLLDFNFSFEKDVALDDVSRSVIEIAEGVNLAKYVNLKNRNTHGYDGMMMFKLVLLGKSIHGYASTRLLASSCKYDTRFISIAQGAKPSHESFQRFIHDDLKMGINEIFYEINRYIEKHDDIDVSTLYIDGSKFEANANKMTFVWKKATIKFRNKCWMKAMEEIASLNKTLKKEGIELRYSVLKEISLEYLMEVCDKIEELMRLKNIEFAKGKGKRKHQLQKHYEHFKDYAVKMWKYAMHMEICGDRNSFSTTDPDATFMHMKYDYYNHTNVFKPGYNVQIGVSDGYIRHLYVSSDATDINTYIPFMEGYRKAYGKLPERTPADAGYGSYDNYMYCKLNGIELMMKYNMQLKESEKTTDKNRFKSYKFEKNEEDEIICPAGHAFRLESIRVETRGAYPRVHEKLVNDHCENCPLRNKCTSSKKGRQITRCRQNEKFHEEVKENTMSIEGTEYMIQRSIQTEGCFGNIKENYKYDKMRRRGESGVKTEFLLVAIGHNIRRYHTRKIEKMKSSSNDANKMMN